MSVPEEYRILSETAHVLGRADGFEFAGIVSGWHVTSWKTAITYHGDKVPKDDANSYRTHFPANGSKTPDSPEAPYRLVLFHNARGCNLKIGLTIGRVERE